MSGDLPDKENLAWDEKDLSDFEQPSDPGSVEEEEKKDEGRPSICITC